MRSCVAEEAESLMQLSGTEINEVNEPLFENSGDLNDRHERVPTLSQANTLDHDPQTTHSAFVLRSVLRPDHCFVARHRD